MESLCEYMGTSLKVKDEEMGLSLLNRGFGASIGAPGLFFLFILAEASMKTVRFHHVNHAITSQRMC